MCHTYVEGQRRWRHGGRVCEPGSRSSLTHITGCSTTQLSILLLEVSSPTENTNGCQILVHTDIIGYDK